MARATAKCRAQILRASKIGRELAGIARDESVKPFNYFARWYGRFATATPRWVYSASFKSNAV